MPSRKAFVLVVDDDVRILRMMQHILELEGYRVLSACNRETALDALYEKTPDLVLLDIMMPGMDGYSVCRHIREFSLVPIIMVTAKGTDEEKVQGLDAGADDYITKPFSSSELVARVRAVLQFVERSAGKGIRPQPLNFGRGCQTNLKRWTPKISRYIRMALSQMVTWARRLSTWE